MGLQSTVRPKLTSTTVMISMASASTVFWPGAKNSQQLQGRDTLVPMRAHKTSIPIFTSCSPKFNYARENLCHLFVGHFPTKTPNIFDAGGPYIS